MEEVRRARVAGENPERAALADGIEVRPGRAILVAGQRPLDEEGVERRLERGVLLANSPGDRVPLAQRECRLHAGLERERRGQDVRVRHRDGFLAPGHLLDEVERVLGLAGRLDLETLHPGLEPRERGGVGARGPDRHGLPREVRRPLEAPVALRDHDLLRHEADRSREGDLLGALGRDRERPDDDVSLPGPERGDQLAPVRDHDGDGAEVELPREGHRQRQLLALRVAGALEVLGPGDEEAERAALLDRGQVAGGSGPGCRDSGRPHRGGPDSSPTPASTTIDRSAIRTVVPVNRTGTDRSLSRSSPLRTPAI